MRLVTFVNSEGLELPGALLDSDQVVLDLQAAHRECKGGASPALPASPACGGSFAAAWGACPVVILASRGGRLPRAWVLSPF